MNRFREILTALALAACASAAIYSFAVKRCVCNSREKSIEQTTLRLFDESEPLASMPKARENLALAQRCLAADPTNINLRMLAAANLRILNRLQDAEREYTRALDFDRRPELYLNLGSTQLELGLTEEATRNLIIATRFNPNLIDSVPATVRGSVYLETERIFRAADSHSK